MFECNCDCHKKNAESEKKNTEFELRKCKENNKRKTNEIHKLKKKLMIATVAIAVGGTFIGKEAFDQVLEYFQKYDKVKQAIDKATTKNDKYEISTPTYYGVSPTPSTLAIFGVYALMPTRRRR